MSDLFKFAYVRGAQNALVKAGALQEYPTVEAADLAVKIASYRITTSPQDQGVSNQAISEAMADLVAMGAKTAEEIMEGAAEVAPQAAAAVAKAVPEALEDAAQAQIAAAQQMLEVADTMEGGGEMTSLAAARLNVARLKQADTNALGAAGAALGGKGQSDLEEDGRGDGYANAGGAPIVPKVVPGAPHTGEMKDHSAGMTSTASVNLDPKTAAAILRKLAEGGALGAEGSDLGGKGQADEEEDSRGDNFAHTPNGAESKVSPSAPFTGGMQDVSQGIVSAPGAVNVTPGKTAAAYETLLRKTASEVGHHLPKALNSTEKLAALRTMMGMTSSEQIEYLSRLNQAVSMKLAEDAEKKDAEEGEGDPEESGGEDAKADETPESEESEAKDEDEEAQALVEQFADVERTAEDKSAKLLRSLGLGL